jgi:hypothetical protein
LRKIRQDFKRNQTNQEGLGTLRWISSIPPKYSVRQESMEEFHYQTNAHKDRQIHTLKGELRCIDETFDNHHQYKEQEISSKKPIR